MATDAERIIRAAYEAFASRDVKALSELADPEIEVMTVTGMLAGHSKPYRGYEGVGQYLEDVASMWSRLELYPESFYPLDDERMMVLGRVRAWHSGGSVDSPNAWLWTLRDGKILRAQVFADPADARRLLAGDEGE